MTRRSRVLLVRLRSLGDAVLMTPALTVLKRNPGTRVAVLLEAPFHEVLANHPDVDRIIAVPRGRSKLLTRSLAIRAARRFSPDLTVDLHGGTTSALITALSGASVRLGYASSRSNRFYSRTVPDSRQIWGKDSIHTVEHQLSPFKHLGFQVDPVPPLQVPVGAAALEQVRTLLSRHGIGEGFLLVHPGAAFDTKQWEPEKFAETAALLEREGHPIVFTAGPGRSRSWRSSGRLLRPRSILWGRFRWTGSSPWPRCAASIWGTTRARPISPRPWASPWWSSSVPPTLPSGLRGGPATA